MRIALVSGYLLVAFAGPAMAQLPPAPPAAQGMGMASGPTAMGPGPMLPGYSGPQNAALNAEPTGAAMGPETYAEPAGEAGTATGTMQGLGTGPDAPGGMMGPAIMAGGTARQ